MECVQYKQKEKGNSLSSFGRIGSWKYGSLVYSATAAEAGMGTEKGMIPEGDPPEGEVAPDLEPETKAELKFVEV